jgi:hypothetical protein
LRFASRAKSIVNRPEINEVEREINIKDELDIDVH